MRQEPPSAGFAEDRWVRTAKTLTAVSALLWLIMFGVLLLADAPRQCPGWHLKDRHETSLWELLFAVGGTLNLFGCVISLKWESVIEESLKRSAAWDLPAAYILTRMLVMNSVVAQWPLFMLLTKCTPLLGPGG